MPHWNRDGRIHISLAQGVWRIVSSVNSMLQGPGKKSYHAPEGEVSRGGGEKDIFYLINNSKIYQKCDENVGGVRNSKIE